MEFHLVIIDDIKGKIVFHLSDATNGVVAIKFIHIHFMKA